MATSLPSPPVTPPWTSGCVPLDWAMTQNNLDNVLQALGQRESGTTRPEGAVMAYDGALAVFIWAGTNHYTEVSQANKDKLVRLLRGKQ
jgi:hypothetical protein